MKEIIQGIILTISTFAIAILMIMVISLMKPNEIPSEPVDHFDTSALETWCGNPQGKIRMVSGWYYEPGVIEDEEGNLWGWNGELNENDFYLLWIEDCGSSNVEDDIILKLFAERG